MLRRLLLLSFLALIGTAPVRSQTFNDYSVVNRTFSVVAYGALPNGGSGSSAISTNNTAICGSYQAAVTNGGGEILFPPGDYYFSVNFPQGCYSTPGTYSVADLKKVSVQGTGEKQSTLHFTGSGDAIHIYDPSSSEADLALSISNIALIGNSAAGHGINLEGVEKIDLNHVLVNSFPGDGLRLNSVQYMKVENSEFSANAGWGAELTDGYTDGVQVNTILFSNSYFISNGNSTSGTGGGVTNLGAREITFLQCTFQDNRNYGALDTVYGGLGSDTLRYIGSHFEWNTGTHHRIQLGRAITEDSSIYASTTAAHGFYVDNVASNTNIQLRNPFFLTPSTTPAIEVLGGADDDIDLGDVAFAPNAQWVVQASNSFVRKGGSKHTTAGANDLFLTSSGDHEIGTDSVQIGDTLTVQAAGVSLKSGATTYGISLSPQGSSSPFVFVGTTSTPVYVTMPQQNGQLLSSDDTTAHSGCTFTGTYVFANVGGTTLKLAVCN